jgi:hypothetical protein
LTLDPQNQNPKRCPWSIEKRRDLERRTMKELLLIAGLALVAGSASAQDYTTQSIGPFDYTHGPNGYSGTGQHIGPFYYYHDNAGNNITGQQIGPFRYYHNYNSNPNRGLRHYDYTNPYRYNQNDDE